MIGARHEKRSLWTPRHIEEICAAVVKGLAMDAASARSIGGAAHQTTTSLGVLVKTVNLTLDAERFFHVILVQGGVELADFFVLAQILGRVLGVAVTAEATLENGATRGFMRILGDADAERGLQDRLEELRGAGTLANALAPYANIH